MEESGYTCEAARFPRRKRRLVTFMLGNRFAPYFEGVREDVGVYPAQREAKRLSKGTCWTDLRLGGFVFRDVL